MARHFARRLSLAFALGALAVVAPAAQSGTPQDPSDQPPIIRTRANFVRVDVYPTKDGAPVRDLTAADFQVFEDGVLQRVDAFEHVLIRPTPQAERQEPSTQRESLQDAANPRNRVFVIFLDAPHVSVQGSHQIAEPLIRLMDRILAPDDLIGVMTPDMSASEIVLARKTQIIEEGLKRNWIWGRRFSLELDEREHQYEICYPPLPFVENGSRRSELAAKMIARKRERATLEALQDVIRYLRDIREERKAVITVSEGWRLFRPDPSLMNLRKGEEVPGRETVVVGPEGVLTTYDRRNYGTLTKTDCDTDRMRLANIDDERFFRDILDDANRANTSFYPVDPRGLPVFDSPIGPDAPPPVNVDRLILTRNLESLQTLALNTDGIAVLNNNDLDRGLRRVADDLTSYYLLGYYSTNTELDGRFRSLKVKVTRPGVEVRARRGYRAPTVEEVTNARRAAELTETGSASAIASALGTLARIRPDARFRIHAVAAPGILWVAGELRPGTGRPVERIEGGSVDIEAGQGSGSTTTRVTLKPGERSFVTAMKLPQGTANPARVRARLTGPDLTVPLTDSIEVDADPASMHPLIYRRGPTTGTRYLPAAEPNFSRTERIRLELPASSPEQQATARLLDRNGQPMGLQFAVSDRTDSASGQRWLMADLTLAPLGAGDYIVELSTPTPEGQVRTLTAVRVTR